MPLRSEVLKARWSIANAPILPFLAPRVFQPWPTSTGQRRKVHSATESVQAAPVNDTTSYETLQQLGENVRRADLPIDWTCQASKKPAGEPVQDVIWHDGQHIDVPNLAGVPHSGRPSSQVQSHVPPETIPRAALHDRKPESAFTISKKDADMENGPLEVGTQGSSSHLRAATSRSTEDGMNQRNQRIWRRVAMNPRDERKTPSLPRLKVSDAEMLHEEWEDLNQNIRSLMWPQFAREALHHGSAAALKFLTATYTDPAVTSNEISDYLDHVIDRCLSPGAMSNGVHLREEDHNLKSMGPQRTKEVTFDELKDAIMKTLHHHRKVHLDQSSIYALLNNMADDHVEGFYRELTQLDHKLRGDTLLHFASRIAKASISGAEISLDILKRPELDTVNFDGPKVMSLCTTILSQSSKAADAHMTVATRLQELLSLGLKFNVIIYNVLVFNAVRIGDFETAWKIHDMMEQGNITPDMYTYSILLNDAKRRMDTVAIQRTVDLATQKGVQNSPYIVTDLLHLMLLLRQNEERRKASSVDAVDASVESDVQIVRRRQRAFRAMLHKYSHHFHMPPLAKFISGFSNLFGQIDQRPSAELEMPPVPTLHVMLSSILWFSNSSQTKALYNRFLELISQRDETALALAAHDHTWALFLMALGRFSERLNDCPQLIKKMLILGQELDAEASLDPKYCKAKSRVKPGRKVPSRIPEPNVYTWSILLHIYTKHKQFRAAEKIITAMQSRGTPPNEVTWTTLVWGYSRAQEVGKVADTIHRMEANGCTVGELAKGAMFRVLDRAGLRTAFAKLEKQRGEISPEMTSHDSGEP